MYIFESQGWGPTLGGFILTTFIGVACIFPGLILLITSGKKNSKSPDKSVT